MEFLLATSESESRAIVDLFSGSCCEVTKAWKVWNSKISPWFFCTTDWFLFASTISEVEFIQKPPYNCLWSYFTEWIFKILISLCVRFHYINLVQCVFSKHLGACFPMDWICARVVFFKANAPPHAPMFFWMQTPLLLCLLLHVRSQDLLCFFLTVGWKSSSGPKICQLCPFCIWPSSHGGTLTLGQRDFSKSWANGIQRVYVESFTISLPRWKYLKYFFERRIKRLPNWLRSCEHYTTTLLLPECYLPLKYTRNAPKIHQYTNRPATKATPHSPEASHTATKPRRMF